MCVRINKNEMWKTSWGLCFDNFCLFSRWTLDEVFFFGGGGGSDPLCLSSSSEEDSDYSFLVNHLDNRDDRNLIAHAMASDFTVASFLKENNWLQMSLYVHNFTSKLNLKMIKC
jgi:hypothetical protein